SEPLRPRAWGVERTGLRAVGRKDRPRHYQPPVYELLAQITSHEPQIRPDHLLGALPCVLQRNPLVWVPNLERPPVLRPRHGLSPSAGRRWRRTAATRRAAPGVRARPYVPRCARH